VLEDDADYVTDYFGLLGSERGILRQVWVQEGWSRDGTLLRTVSSRHDGADEMVLRPAGGKL
jgi:hypothetical protein